MVIPTSNDAAPCKQSKQEAGLKKAVVKTDFNCHAERLDKESRKSLEKCEHLYTIVRV